jgi:2-amino-4-hydroxy-6-hydroxymethyldihydropteridine diphosphokinase
MTPLGRGGDLRMTRAYLSLGSNLEPERHLRSALAELRARYGGLVISPVYRTRAAGFEGPDFLNLVVGLDTDEDLVALDAWLHALEDRHGRRRDVPRFSSRTLDADVVLFGHAASRGPGNLEVPRPDLARYAFVLKPMADIAPELVHPVLRQTLAQMWAAFPAAERNLTPIDTLLL